MAYALVTAPTGDVVSLDEAKAHCRVETTDDDTLIGALIEAAVQSLDGYTGTLGRALLPQTWKRTVAAPEWDRDLCARIIRLDVPPVSSVTSVKYVVGGSEQTLDAAQWRLGFDTLGAFVALNDGYAWPCPDHREDAFRVEFVCGYADTGSVPRPIKQAILLTVGHYYEHREATAEAGSLTDLPMGVQALLAPWRVTPFV